MRVHTREIGQVAGVQEGAATAVELGFQGE